MGSYNSTANIVLNINGQQTKRVLASLEKDAKNFERAIQKAAAAGDKVKLKKLQRELNQTKQLIDKMKGSAATAEQVLLRLDKATPKELNNTLRTLQLQLNGIQRGSKQWDAHVAKIKMVKAELQKVNSQLYTQQSLWNRFNNWLNNFQTMIFGVVGAMTGLIMAGRKAVNAYAEMDEQLANTRKYTGMVVEDVEKLNEAFRKMDTRTPRAKLNELAQEAGRLGKNNLKDVQGYVEAADIINVALVDLGEGSTQTIAKLTNIFGVEKALGTKKAMLSVGSAVNVLSQNCTASKPYLVEFAQRMAGIGAQAGMSIPEILAFGAVLDANGQKVEMSATALQKVIMNLANKNKEFAQVVGLDAQELNDTLKRSAKDGLMMYLQALHDIGEKSSYSNATMILAPVLKDMGLDAARVSQVLSTLAKHIDEVKWQMGNAQKAFDEASSATNEYTIFNNTAQASIDKAKKRVTELAIELGEKLYPIMKHIYTSSGIFLRVLNVLVDFFVKNKTVIIALTGALVTYNATMLIHNNTTRIAATFTKAWHGVLNLCKGVMPAVRLIVAGLTNTVQYFTNGLQVNYAMQQKWQNALKAMKFSNWAGLAVAAITAITVAMTKLINRTSEYEKKLNEATQTNEEFEVEVQKEVESLQRLIGTLKGSEKGTERYEKAKESILSQYGRYLAGLVNERGEIINLEGAYNRLTQAIRLSRQERGLANAEKNVNDVYNEEMKSLGKRFYDALINSGVSHMDASEIYSKVITYIEMGEPIPVELATKIAGAYRGSGGKYEGIWGSVKKGYDKFTGNFEMPHEVLALMSNAANKRAEALKTVEDKRSEIRPYSQLDDDMLNTLIRQLDNIANRGPVVKGDVLDVNAALKGKSKYISMNKADAANLYEQLVLEKSQRTGGSAKTFNDYFHDKRKWGKYKSYNLEDMMKQATELLATPLVQNMFEFEEYDTKGGKKKISISRADLQKKLDEWKQELLYRDKKGMAQEGSEDFNYTSQKETEKAQKKAEQEQNKREREAQRILKEELKEEKKNRDEALAALEARRGSVDNPITDNEYKIEKDKIEKKFVADSKKVLDSRGFGDTAEYAALVRKEEELMTKLLDHLKKTEIDSIDENNKIVSRMLEQQYRREEISYQKYLDDKDNLDMDSIKQKIKVYQDYNLTQHDDYQKLLDDQYNLEKQIDERRRNRLRAENELRHKAAEVRIEQDYFTPGTSSFMNAVEKDKQIFEEMIKYLTIKRDTYLKGSEEWQRIDEQILDTNNKRKTQMLNADAEYYQMMMAQEIAKSEFEIRVAMLERVYKHEMELAEDNEERKKQLTKGYYVARAALADQYGQADGKALKKAAQIQLKWFEKDGAKAITGTLSTITSSISDLFSGINDLLDAELEAAAAKIEKRYDAEIAKAEGNAYMIAKIEKQKEKEIAQVKEEANRKAFAMQVIQAIAQTAQNAISAYGSAVAIPVVGTVLAPIAAAMAVAAGMLQVAAIKKQQQAAEATGYAEGGFTPDGDAHKPVGIVHAGEWVASQKLTHNPKTRPLLVALDNAQRNNTIGALTADAVSALMPSAPISAARRAKVKMIDAAESQNNQVDILQLSLALAALNKRLSEPFITVNTVTGDAGIKKAQDEYQRLMKNKSPKY